MEVIAPFFPYALGIATYWAWSKLKAEANRGQGGEIERILKLKI